ncbi:MAG: hypothetical protein WBG86_20815, partial [Polyangiales bacterium]
MAPRKSPHFDAVAAELQLGGTVFAYVDIDGDAARAADFLASLLRSVPDARSNEGSTINPTRIVDAVGLGGLRAVGMSSYANGELYHNRSVVYATGPREGVLE